VQTNSIEKQLHRISDVLLPLPAETQPTRPSLVVTLFAVARVEKMCATAVEGTGEMIMADEYEK
jgi:hypothetical protein